MLVNSGFGCGLLIIAYFLWELLLKSNCSFNLFGVHNDEIFSLTDR